MKGYIISGLLSRIHGVVHGFGTRNGGDIGDKFPVAHLKQIHSARVIQVAAAGSQGEADAMIASVPGIALAIRTADCLPVLISDSGGKVVSAVHAGWRGVLSGIVNETLKTFRDVYKFSGKDIIAAIGPCIEKSCYEVGNDVVSEFRNRYGWWANIIEIKNGRNLLDLRKSITIQLKEEGVHDRNIDHVDICTFCRGDLLYSWRRDKDPQERMHSFIVLKG